jgi:hypothetical protein
MQSLKDQHWFAGRFVVSADCRVVGWCGLAIVVVVVVMVMSDDDRSSSRRKTLGGRRTYDTLPMIERVTLPRGRLAQRRTTGTHLPVAQPTVR